MPRILRAIFIVSALLFCGTAIAQSSKQQLADSEIFCFYGGMSYSLGATLCTYKDTFQVCLTPMYDWSNGAAIRRAEKDPKFDGPHWVSSGGNGACSSH
jgi:ABC-type Fe3+-siderophore transport system permease subunit